MHWGNLRERVIDLTSAAEVAAITRFLSGFDLSFDAAVDYTIALMQDDEIVATGSLDGEVLRNFAILEDRQGEDLTAKLINPLVREANRRGRYHFFVFTKPETACVFASLGFGEVARATGAALLETGIGSIASHCADLKEIAAALPAGPRAALVVNCNPFTLGHRAVIERAAAENAHVVVLVVSEDASTFPFETRIRLVRAGLAHLDNVTVIPGGKYIVSAATFPGYFTKGEATVTAQTELDVTIFARHIAPALGVTRRYVGTEPLDLTTRAYNDAMMRILPAHGIALEVMPRIVQAGGAPVSASAVRAALREDRWDDLRALVPDTTYAYLRSPEAGPVIGKLKASLSRH